MENPFFREGSLWAAVLVIVLTLLVYASSLKNSFVLDDFYLIVNNDFVKSWKNFPAIFSRTYFMGSGELTYRPVVTASYFVDYSLWRLNPFGYHLTNLILHLSNLILLYFFINLITRDTKIALLTSLFFGLHPIHSEVVNTIAFREDLLAFLFYILSFILFIKSDAYQGRKRLFVYFTSVSFFLLALFSKEMAITLPILLVLYDYYFLFQEEPKKIFSSFKSRYLGYMAVGLIYLWLSFFLIGNIGKPLAGYPGGNFYTNILTISKVIATYIKWLFIPTAIRATLPYPSSYALDSFFRPEAFFSVWLVIASLVLAISLYKKSKMVSFAMLWFFITLLPVSNLVPIKIIIANRYLYIPGVGFCFLITLLLLKLPTSKIFSIPARILQLVARDTIIVLVIFYSTFTIIRSLAWKNNLALLLEMAETYPDNPRIHRNLGVCLMNAGLLDKAISEYKMAIELEPGFVRAYNDLGVCYRRMRLYKEAIDNFEQAIRLDPRSVQAYYNLGLLYTEMKNYHQAKKTFEKVLEISPECKEAQVNLERLRALGN